MLKLQSAVELREYCLRKLGKPVINVEVETSQSVDRINDAIEYFIERHFNGVTESFYKVTISEEDVTNGYISLPDDVVVVTDVLSPAKGYSIEVMDDFEFNVMDEMMRTGMVDVLDYYLTMTHLKMVQDMFTQTKMYSFNGITRKIIPQYNFSSYGSSNLLESYKDISQDDWTAINATLTGNNKEVTNGDLTADTITSDGAGNFGFEQTIDTSFYVRGLYTLKVRAMLGTYTGDVKLSIFDEDDTLVKTETFTTLSDSLWQTFSIEGTFGTTHGKGIKVKVESVSEAVGAGETFFMSAIAVYKNALLLIQGYSAVDPDTSIDVYNDRWIKKYATQQMKKQWGTNLKKYEGVAMAGGVTVTGQTIYDEAIAELEALEQEFSLTYELPIDFYLA